MAAIGRILHLFFGGTFDPVHNGHLRLLWEVDERLQPDRVHLVPNHIPPHKSQPASPAAQRLEMLRVAVQGQPRWQVDTRELNRHRPSYTVETLEDLRRELGPEASLVWLIGMDSFASLDGWHRWRELTHHAHLAVVGRPGSERPASGAVIEWAGERELSIEALRETPAGGVVHISTTLLNIASTALRQGVREGLAPRFLVPDAVCDYIARHRLYR